MSFDELVELPEGWVWAKLGELGLFINGDRGKNYPNKTALVESGIPFINAGHIQNGIINLSEMSYISKERFDLLGSGKVKPNDILYCLRGSLGKTAIVKNITTGAIASSLVIIRPYNFSNHEYLFYYLISPCGDAEILKYDNGSAQPNLSAKNVRSYSIPLPPLNEQRRIVAKIEALKARSQRVKDALEDIPQLLDQFRQSVLAAAFRGDLTADWREKAEVDFNKEWKNLTLKVLLSEPLANGRSVPDANEGFPVLRLTCLKNGHIDLNERKIGAWNKKEAENFLVHKYDFFVSRGNGSLSLVGRGGLVDCIPDEVAYPDTLIRIRVKHEICFPKFLSLVWNSFVIREQVEASARTTAGIHKINQKSMEQFVLPIPPIAEQDEILRCVSSLFTLADNIEKQYQQAKANIYQLDQSILAKAFRGELVPQDPNDEPASVLLESIRAERTKLETKIAKKSTTKISTRSTKNVQAQPEESLQLKLELE